MESTLAVRPREQKVAVLLRRIRNMRYFVLLVALGCAYRALTRCISRVPCGMGKDPRPLITFSGGGFMMAYYFGIAIYLRDHFDVDNLRLATISGGSAALIALTMGLDIYQVMMLGLHSMKWLNAQGGPYLMNFHKLSEFVRGLFSEIGLTDEDVARTSAQNRAFIGVTQCFPVAHKCLNVPENTKDLIDLYLSSQCVLPFFRTPGVFQGKYYVDGAFSAFWSVPDSELISDAITVTCVPSYFTRLWPQTLITADIQPAALDIASIFVMYPWSHQQVQIKLGYEDAKRNHDLLVARGLRPLPHAPITPWNEWEALFASVDENDLPPLSKVRSTAAASGTEQTHERILRTYSESDLQSSLSSPRLRRLALPGSQSDAKLVDLTRTTSIKQSLTRRSSN